LQTITKEILSMSVYQKVKGLFMFIMPIMDDGILSPALMNWQPDPTVPLLRPAACVPGTSTTLHLESL